MLTDRQLLILQVIVDDFINSAQPVGSRTLSKKDSIKLSSATVRNEMSELEEKGFIEKPHTSAGRIPSQKGYRFYVDNLLPQINVEEKTIQKVNTLLHNKYLLREKVIHQAANLLSEISDYTAIALGSMVTENRLKKIQIVPLTDTTAVMIIITNKGHVQNQIVNIPQSMDASDIEKFVNIINQKLVNVPIASLGIAIQKEVKQLLHQNINNYEMLLNHFQSSNFDESSKNFMHVSGKTKMFNQPEFMDIEKIRALLEMLEEDEQLINLVRPRKEGITVTIGKENNIEKLENCTIVTATYSLGEEKLGTLALLGPTRMEYSKVIPLLKLFTHQLSLLNDDKYK
ncbi:MAG: heat-inducible transcriptional repressor HrcA [Bacillales bacterium]|jgi:heat-inducible transcriptional repressor|nr:heat-inducible transcriptional repressor HrcA [Bacillales bacterium]